jgi:hypothetical protein
MSIGLGERILLENHTTGLQEDHKSTTRDFNKITTEIEALLAVCDDIHWPLSGY